ncbi:DUF3331 domain-containing protein [Paraburkholderia sp. CNPSo 3157]|uniref:DUF3331 domain-containing protein n=1 Tax=Paraburkholderia franconis TaxID=2654983 RepID=A0A7X1N6T9_9BURK|nr:DUF3331 domain-containing protein [Paraburkholderia franconis]MPW16419.1 DUF3331 domain-containing protein [Paraburkholderia franconis]
MSRIGTATGTTAEPRRPAHANRRASAEVELRRTQALYADVGREAASGGSAPAKPALRDPWTTTISRLGKSPSQDTKGASSDKCDNGACAARAARRTANAERARSQAASDEHSAAVITFVERFGAKSVSITWRDSTAGRYTEQLWVRRIARSRGVCALTGEEIVRGDAVYGPFSRPSSRPRNMSEMILAKLLDDLE